MKLPEEGTTFTAHKNACPSEHACLRRTAMRNKTNRLLACVASLTLMAATSAAFAQDGPPPPQGNGDDPRPRRELGDRPGRGDTRIDDNNNGPRDNVRPDDNNGDGPRGGRGDRRRGGPPPRDFDN